MLGRTRKQLLCSLDHEEVDGVARWSIRGARESSTVFGLTKGWMPRVSRRPLVASVIIDTATNDETIIGDIQVRAEWKGLRSDATCFTEYYSPLVKQAIGDEDDGKPNPRVCHTCQSSCSD